MALRESQFEREKYCIENRIVEKKDKNNNFIFYVFVIYQGQLVFSQVIAIEAKHFDIKPYLRGIYLYFFAVTSETMEFEDVPIRLEKTLDNVKFATQKLEFVKEDGKTKVKQEFWVYEAQENYELLCKLVRTYMRSVKDYDLFKLLGLTKVYDRFWQCLRGDSLDT